jgi:hypothetical protein
MTRRNSKIAAVRYSFLALALVCLAGSSWAAAGGAPEFKGKIAERYEDSVRPDHLRIDEAKRDGSESGLVFYSGVAALDEKSDDIVIVTVGE